LIDSEKFAIMVHKRGGEKMICQGCGQEFTPMPRSESKTLCPKCFIKKLDGLIGNNPGIDPAQNKTMDQPTDPKQPEPTAPDVPADAPATPASEEPAGEEGPAETPVPGEEVPEGEKKKEKSGETPVGGETPSPTA
jgi:hypothetical protein